MFAFPASNYSQGASDRIVDFSRSVFSSDRQIPKELTTYVRYGYASVSIGEDENGPIEDYVDPTQVAYSLAGGELGLASWSSALNLLPESHDISKWDHINAVVDADDCVDSLRRLQESAKVTAEKEGGYICYPLTLERNENYVATAFLRNRSKEVVRGKVSLHDINQNKELGFQEFTLWDYSWSSRVETSVAIGPDTEELNCEIRVTLFEKGHSVSVDLAGVWAGSPPSILGVRTSGSAASVSSPSISMEGEFLNKYKGEVSLDLALSKYPSTDPSVLVSSPLKLITIDKHGHLGCTLRGVTDSEVASVVTVHVLPINIPVSVRVRWNLRGLKDSGGKILSVVLDGSEVGSGGDPTVKMPGIEGIECLGKFDGVLHRIETFQEPRPINV